jgi:hypothetical protein
MLETKFHAHTKELAELWFCIFSPLCSQTAGGRTEGSEPNGSKHTLYFIYLISTETAQHCIIPLYDRTVKESKITLVHIPLFLTGFYSRCGWESRLQSVLGMAAIFCRGRTCFRADRCKSEKLHVGVMESFDLIKQKSKCLTEVSVSSTVLRGIISSTSEEHKPVSRLTALSLLCLKRP